MSGMPRISSVMTPFPHAIAASAPLAEAEAMMAVHRIRHLPVKDGAELAGVVSDHDVERTFAAAREEGDRRALTVRDACTRHCYVVDVSHPLDRVLDEMARRRIGSVLVVKDERLAGIFTATDAFRVLARKLREAHPAGGDDAA